jgi:hypothetical protein
LNYREAKKIKVGDVVVDHCGHRHKVRVVNDITMDKRVSMQFEDSDVVYAHTAIHSIEPPNKTHEKYYMVIAFNRPDDIDEICSSHIYPSYISCMSVKGGLSKSFPFSALASEPLMLQNNPHDGLKFIDEYNARKMFDRAIKSHPNKELKIIEMDALVFGRIHPRWVVNL